MKDGSKRYNIAVARGINTIQESSMLLRLSPVSSESCMS
jgi:hypothetical protein